MLCNGTAYLRPPAGSQYASWRTPPNKSSVGHYRFLMHFGLLGQFPTLLELWEVVPDSSPSSWLLGWQSCALARASTLSNRIFLMETIDDNDLSKDSYFPKHIVLLNFRNSSARYLWAVLTMDSSTSGQGITYRMTMRTPVSLLLQDWLFSFEF